MWSECSWVIRMAEISRGSRPNDFTRLKVSRQEMPASTSKRAHELSTMAVFPRLPLASTETEIPMLRSIHSLAVELGVTLWHDYLLDKSIMPRVHSLYGKQLS